MKWHEFIFSNRPQYRVTRHIVFWMTCWTFYLCTYFVPVICFPAWKFQGQHMVVINKLGSLGYCMFSFVFSSRFMIFQLLITYFLMYYLMPKYLIREKYWSFCGVVMVTFIIVAAINTYINYVTQPFLYQLFNLAPPANLSKTLSFTKSMDAFFFNIPATIALALSIKMLKHWYQKQKESQQLIISKANAELQLLKAQVHPHFLFNTLNNIYSFILTASPKAPEMIKKLSGLLHYIIHECNQPSVELEKELKMIRDYIALETIRYGDQFDISVDTRGDYNNKNIAPLLLLPFVENSFKHGTSKMLSKPWVTLNIIIEDKKMYFMLSNSKPAECINASRNSGIGLSNVQKRLQLLYPGRHQLKMTAEPEHFTILLELDMQTVNEKPVVKKIKKETLKYEMA